MNGVLFIVGLLITVGAGAQEELHLIAVQGIMGLLAMGMAVELRR